MRFDLRANSPDMMTSVYPFPGDEAISHDVYHRVIYGGYVTTTATLYGAALAVGVPVDAETFERWKRVGAAAGLLDDFLDESPDPAESQRLYDHGLASQIDGPSYVSLPKWGDERLVPAVNLMITSASSLPESKRLGLISAARSIGRISLQKTSAPNLKAYISLLQQEAADSNYLILNSASEHMYHSPRFSVFSDWCKQAILLGTLYDHARDLRTDHRLGRTSVEPSLRNQLKLGIHALRPFGNLMSSHTTRKASRAAIAARIRYSPRPTKQMFKRTTPHDNQER